MAEKGTPAIEDRKQRMEIARKILVSRKKIDFSEAVALISFNLGITERKAKEYIGTLILVDGIRREGDKIVRGK